MEYEVGTHIDLRYLNDTPSEPEALPAHIAVVPGAKILFADFKTIFLGVVFSPDQTYSVI